MSQFDNEIAGTSSGEHAGVVLGEVAKHGADGAPVIIIGEQAPLPSELPPPSNVEHITIPTGVLPGFGASINRRLRRARHGRSAPAS